MLHKTVYHYDLSSAHLTMHAKDSTLPAHCKVVPVNQTVTIAVGLKCS